MITTQKIVKLFSNTLASLVCLMSTYVFALELPYSARLVLSDETDVKIFPLVKPPKLGVFAGSLDELGLEH